jgi:hypothetical protein
MRFLLLYDVSKGLDVQERILVRKERDISGTTLRLITSVPYEE